MRAGCTSFYADQMNLHVQQDSEETKILSLLQSDGQEQWKKI